MTSQTNKSYGGNVDSLTYNAGASAGRDNDDFVPSRDDNFQPVGARGADNQPTGRNFRQEDQEAASSEATGKIPKGEVNDLLSSSTEAERSVKGRTRGVSNDAFKQERELDKSMKDAGVLDDDKDIEIGAATGA
ncbi:hypothetical protein BXZ70DRAFT_907090 [Cristinia sonorae]|uniref:Uncharacterized protein n=1 Tax=Cristinia sonorae TaxID=1940300 RepID=A0A8K0XQR6_9AGAR|nr:hypothetical protein BXZ70DRAFT_907090 [Cristinia sonorae]